MKANELMIGDWLTANRRECVGDGGQFIAWKEIGKIARIYEDTVMLLFPTREDDWEEMYLMDVEPIQLTPEILEKNGFGFKKEDRYGDEHITHFYPGEKQFCKDSDVHIGTNNEGHFWLNVRHNAIYGLRYVHELQHALKLYGIEKNIEL